MEVGVGNPAEETCCYPNARMLHPRNGLSTGRRAAEFFYRSKPKAGDGKMNFVESLNRCIVNHCRTN